MSKRMQKAIDKVVEGSGLLVQYQEAITNKTEFHLRVTHKSYLPLIIEVIGSEISVSHTYTQNGDLMRDPEMVFNAQSWLVVEITQDPAGHYQRIPAGKYSPSLESFAHMWSKNIKEQGFCEPKGLTYESLTHPIA